MKRFHCHSWVLFAVMILAFGTSAHSAGHVFTYVSPEGVFIRYAEESGGLPDGYHVYRRGVGESVWNRLTSAPLTPILDVANLRNIAGSRADVLISLLGGNEKTRLLRKQDVDRVLADPERRNFIMAMTLALPGLGQALGQEFVDREVVPDGSFEYRVTAIRGNQEADVVTTGTVLHGTTTVLPIPINATVSAGDRNVYLDWARNKAQEMEFGIVGYNVYRAQSDVSQPFVRVNSTPVLDMSVRGSDTTQPGSGERAFRDGDLSNGVRYWYRLTAVNVFGFESEPSAAVSVIPQDATAPPAVGELMHRIHGRSVVLTWTPIKTAERVGYVVMRKQEDSTEFQRIAPSSGRGISTSTYVDTQVVDGAVYWYQVAAVDSAGNIGSPSPTIQVVILDVIPPPKVTNLKVTASAVKEVRLKWDAVRDAGLAGYILERSLTAYDVDEYWFRLNDRLTVTEYTDSLWELQEGTVSYRVRAFDHSDNRGPWSDIVSVRPPDAVPPPTPVLTGVIRQGDTIRVQWERVQASDLSGYIIWRADSKDGKFGKVTDRKARDTTTVYLDRMTRQTGAVWYRVSAIDVNNNESGMGNPVGVALVDETAPPTPTGFKAESLQQGVRLTWRASTASDLAGYNIYRSGPDGTTTQLFAQLPDSLQTFVDRTVELGKTYIYEVSAFDQRYNLGRRAGPITVTYEPPKDRKR